MFLKNAWYMAGWADDFAIDQLCAITILNEPIVIYHKTDGTLAALEDRCCHRLVPLSIGRREGDALRCMYHGIKFGPDGRCTEIPGQKAPISSAIRVRSYPVVQRHGAAWVWMGDPARADAAQIPPIIGPDDPEWAVVPSVVDIHANAHLIVDNVLDLSHAPYVHAASFGNGDESTIKTQISGEANVEVTRLERGVRTARWHLGRPSNPYTGNLPSDDLVVSEILVPGVFILRTRVYEPGVQTRASKDGLPIETPIMARATCQMITPVTDQLSKFFFTFGPWAPLAEHKQTFFAVGQKAFAEDKAIIEQQQDLINRSPGTKMMMLSMDTPVVRYNRIYERLMEQDQAREMAEPA